MNQVDNQPEHNITPVEEVRREIKGWRLLWKSEDYMAIWTGFVFLIVLLVVLLMNPLSAEKNKAALEKVNEYKLESKKSREEIKTAKTAEEKKKLETAYKAVRKKLEKQQAAVFPHPMKSWFAKLDKWESDPMMAFGSKKTAVENKEVVIKDYSLLPGMMITGGVLLVLTFIGTGVMSGFCWQFIPAFIILFLLCILSFLLAGQKVVSDFNLEYPLWALLTGVIISNTIGTPKFMKPVLRTEYYVKTGLVLLGSTILLSKLLALSLPGVMVSWVVTPVVLITTYWFGQRILKIESRSLNMTICADMSVCGVSAAIATGAACRARRDEVSLAITMSLAFTVIMMIVQPWFIRAVGMNEVLAGAWIGGTIDSTGAVSAAGAFLGSDAEMVASVVKMIQNILIGVIAFGVAVYWVSVVEPSTSEVKPSLWEVWRRFPKFILGFVGASVLFSYLATSFPRGELMVKSVTSLSDIFRNMLFCMAFVCIGLESSIRELIAPLKNVKPLVLYVVGQSLNLLLTFLMAYLMFEVMYPNILSGLGE